MMRAHGNEGGSATRFLLTMLVMGGIILCSVAASTAMSGRATQTVLGDTATPNVSLASGYYHSLLVNTDGTLWAWGRNESYQLGLNNTDLKSSPTQVGSGSNWDAVDAGWYHSVGVRSDGTLWAWGRNERGQLGVGDNTTRKSPTQVGTATNWKAVSTGQYHSLGLRSNGTLWAWGDNFEHQLGLGDNVSWANAPTQVGSWTDWVYIAAGDLHSLGVRSNGRLYGWGYNSNGQTGNGGGYATPTQVGTETDWVAVASEFNYSMGLRSDHTLWAWGYNGQSQLGLGHKTDASQPTRVGSATNWVGVAPGRVHCLGIQSDGTLWAWGANYEGELGLGTKTEKLIPEKVPSATNWVAASDGDAFSVGVRSDGTLWGWGRNGYGQLGLGNTGGEYLTPEKCPTLTMDWPPSVSTEAATGISSTAATLNGNHGSRGSASSVQVSFQWGLTTNYGNTTTVQNMSSTGPFSAAISNLKSQTTYHYRAKAEGDGDDYGDDRTFTTNTTPPAPPTVITGAASEIGTSSGTLSGNLTNLGTSGSVTVSFAWGFAAGGPYPYPVTISPPMTGPGAFSAPLSGLSPKTKYYYMARAVGDGSDEGDEASFTTLALAPSVTTGVATNLTTSSATLNGNLDSLGTSASVTVSFAWGTTAGGPYPHSVAVSPVKTSPGAFSAPLSGLSPKMTYYYIAKAVGDGSDEGAQTTFITGTIPPVVTTGTATSLGTTSATLGGTLSSLGTGSSVQVCFEYGPTTSYGNTTTPQTLTGTSAFNFAINGLAPATTYHFRAKATGDGSSYGPDMSFTTTTTPPVVATNDPSSITTNAARLNGYLTSAGTAGSVTVSVAWGTSSGSYSNETAGQAMATAGAFYFDLSSLTPGTTYYCQAKAVGNGDPVYGVEKSFTTGQGPKVDTVDPGSGKQKQHLTVAIWGSSFDGATKTSFGSGIVVEDFTVNSSTKITAEIAIAADATEGFRGVSVTTGWGTATKTDGFSVVSGGGGICSSGALATPGSPSEMTTVFSALGLFFGLGYWFVRRGTKSARKSVLA